MAAEGRMDSFNTFMVGKFFRLRKTPERLQALEYDLASFVGEASSETSTNMIDVGEFNDDLGATIPGITLVTW
ncbi:hypothetical protein BDW71DRAFT_205829 [Aspergillus fruticulosus]